MTEHLGPLISALLDGELTTDGRARSDAHLARCSGCQRDLRATAAARALVRGLPPVEPPFGFLEGLPRPSRRRPASAVAFAAAAAAVFTLAVSPPSEGVAPAIGQFAAAHSTALPAAAPVTLVDASFPYRAPAQLRGGYELIATYRRGDVLHMVYGDGLSALSVFEQPGHIDWEAMPTTGRPVTVAGHPAYTYTWNGARVVTWQAGNLAYTLVSAAEPNEVMAAAGSLPEPGAPSVAVRVRQAARELLETLSGR